MNIRRIYIITAAALFILEFILMAVIGNVMLVYNYFLAVWVPFVLAGVVYNCFWIKKFTKKLKDLSPILTEEKNPDKFIAANRELLKEYLTPGFRNVVISNIAIGYCEKKDFELARKELMTIEVKKLFGKFKKVYYMELAYVTFFLGDFESGLSIVKEHEQSINSLKKDPALEPCVSVINIFRYIAEKNYVKANEMLFVAEERFGQGDFEGEFKYLKECVGRHEREHG